MNFPFSAPHTRRRILATAVLAMAGVTAAVTALPAAAQDASKKQLTIGGTAGSNIDQLQYGIVPILQKKGYKLYSVNCKYGEY